MLAQPVSSASVRGRSRFWPSRFRHPPLQVSTKSMALLTTGHIVLGEPPVAGDQHVMPHPGGDVGAEVAVAVGVLDDAVAQLDRPGAVGPLVVPAPVERRARRVPKAPRRSAPSRSRRDPTGRCGPRRTRAGRRRTPAWRQSTWPSAGTAQASERLEHRESREPHSTGAAAGFLKYSATLLPINGFSATPRVRVSHGLLIMSHTSSLWYAVTAGCFGLSTPDSAFQPPERRVQGVRMMRCSKTHAACDDLVQQFVGAVDPDVPALVGVVLVGQQPADLLRQPARHRDRQRATGLEHADQFGDRPVVRGHVLEDLRGDHAVECAVGVGQLQRVTLDRLGLAPTQAPRPGPTSPAGSRRRRSVPRRPGRTRRRRRRGGTPRRSAARPQPTSMTLVPAPIPSRSKSTVSIASTRSARSYTETVCAATDSQLNTSTARRRPFAPRRRSSSGESSSSPSTAASSSTSPGATSRAHSPSGPTTSGSAPARLATIGVPLAMASTAGSENPSYSEGMQATSATPAVPPVPRRTARWRCARCRRCRVRRSASRSARWAPAWRPAALRVRVRRAAARPRAAGGSRP